jgi:phosphatidylglycerol:prolipoprotein diacylglycerol transferase
MLTYPGFDPVAFSLGPLHVRWYGLTYVIAFAAAWWLARRRAARPGSTWSAVDVDDFVFFAMLGVILGGRLGYVLFYGLSFWAEDPWYPLRITSGGMSFHGGLIGVLLALAWFARSRGRQIADVFDFAAALPGIGIFAVRMGNFINGELWGRPGWWMGCRVTRPRSTKRCSRVCCSPPCSGGSPRSRGRVSRLPACSS